MARFGNAQSVSKPTGVCFATGETLKPSTPAIAVLLERESDDGFERLDFSLEGWEQGDKPEQLFSHWQYTVPDSSKKPEIVIDDAVLVDLFERLAGDERPKRIAFRYILALALLRKRKLQLLGRESHDEGEVWLLRFKGTDGEPMKVHNPGIEENEIQDLSDQLGEILQGEF